MTRFCEMHWKTPAVILGLLCMATFAWGFHVWKDMAGMRLTPVGNLSRAAVGRHIAGPAASPPSWSAGQAVAAIVAGTQAGAGQGSGVFVHPDGYLLTARHLVRGGQDITVRFTGPAGTRSYRAEVVKVAPAHDLALLKVISRESFPFAAMGDSRGLKSGQQVFAVALDSRQSLTTQAGRVGRVNGRISLSGVAMDSLVETDAVLDPAQTGGPLVDAAGRMVGMNIVVSDATGRPRGYAVPSHVLVAHFRDVVDLAAQASAVSGKNPGRAAALPAAAGVEGVRARLASLTDHVIGETVLGFSLPTTAGLLLLGFVSGLSGGMMTMGGGLIKITGLMLLYGYGILLIRPVAYLSNIFIYGAAALRYRRDGLLDMERVKPFIPWAIAGVVLGYFAGTLMSDAVIRYLLAGFAILMGLRVLGEMAEGRREEECVPARSEDREEDPYGRSGRTPASVNAHGLLGLPMGLISGILGITGGVIEVPLQNYVAGIPLRQAIANCSVLVFFTSAVASVLSIAHGVMSGAFTLATPLALTAMLLPGAFAGGLFGAWLTKVAPFGVLRGVYALLMFAMAAKMLL